MNPDTGNRRMNGSVFICLACLTAEVKRQGLLLPKGVEGIAAGTVSGEELA